MLKHQTKQDDRNCEINSVGPAIPERFLRILVSVFISVFVMLGVARANGSGLVQVVAALISAGVIVAFFLPLVYFYHLKINLRPENQVITRLEPAIVYATINRSVQIKGVDRTYSVAKGQPFALTIRPSYLGKVTTLLLEVSTSYPFGVFTWRRGYQIPIKPPLLVQPRVRAEKSLSMNLHRESGSKGKSGVGLVRGSREYVFGDDMRTVNWRLYAHTGSLQVVEREAPEKKSYEISIQLRSEEDLDICLERLVRSAASQDASDFAVRFEGLVDSNYRCRSLDELRLICAKTAGMIRKEMTLSV